MSNVIRDTVFSMRRSDADGNHWLGKKSLVEVIQTLWDEKDGEYHTFPHLRPHQTHAWHSFLVQLAVISLLKANVTKPVTRAELTYALPPTVDHPDHSTMWETIVPDITKPAFLQPPVSIDTLASDFKTQVVAPDQLDILVTSRNHDVKSAVGYTADEEDWLFALLTLQTMAGFDGNSLYGIARMNGGMGSRPCFSLAPQGGAGMHFRRDVTALYERLSHPNADITPFDRNGITLLWAEPWDGLKEESLPVEGLHPLFIEVCRRIRLGNNCAIRATSKGPRVDAKARSGVMGDPWTPVFTKGKVSKSLTASIPDPTGSAWHYRRVTDLLTATEWTAPVLAQQSVAEALSPMQLVARCLIRGQGKTEGYHERVIPLREGMEQLFGNPDNPVSQPMLGSILNDRIADITRVKRNLGYAIQVYASGGSRGRGSQEVRNMARSWVTEFDQIVDASFFESAQDEIMAEMNGLSYSAILHRTVNRAWLATEGRAVLESAMQCLPCPIALTHKGRVQAVDVYESRMRSDEHGFPEISIPEPNPEPESEPALPPPAEESADTRPVHPAVSLASLLPRNTQARTWQEQLCRMDTASPDSPAFWWFVERNQIDDSDQAILSKWGLICYGVAMMTPMATGKGTRQTAHDQHTPVGKALSAGGEFGSRIPVYGETSLHRLLTADGKELRRLLAVMFRVMAKANQSFDWEEMSRIVMDSDDRDALDAHRHRLAADYYRLPHYYRVPIGNPGSEHETLATASNG